MPATLSVQNTAFAAEASAIPQSLEGTAVALARTAVVAETSVADINSVNRQLIATVDAVVPAAPAPQSGVAPVASSGNTTTSDTTASSLVDIGVTQRKRDSDGCADGTQSQFPIDTPIIYATTRAPSINAGEVVSVEWKYQGQVVGSGSYTLPQDQNQFLYVVSA